MKAFISYSSKQDSISKELKKFLRSVEIESFVASDDLRVASNWKETIITNLRESSIFIPLLSKEFKDSEWCSQEMGIAYIQNKTIIPISIDGIRSYGFINHIQSKSIIDNDKDLLVLEGLLEHNIENGINGIFKLLIDSGSFRYSEQIFETLEPFYKKFTEEQINRLVEICIANVQIWDASECNKRYLPRLIKEQSKIINPKLFKKLEYQISNRKWYSE